MGTVSNPAKLSSIKAAWAATQNNFASYYRGGPVVNIGDSATIPTAAAGMKMSQFNGVAAQHTTSYTTSWTTTFTTSAVTSATTGVAASHSTTTSFNTLYPVCLEKGTLVTLPDGREVPVETLREGDEVLSVSLPGLEPETQNLHGYVQYRSNELASARVGKTRIAKIIVDVAEFLVRITMDGRKKPLRVTPSHPLFVYDPDEGRFMFVRADAIDVRHKLVDKYLRLVNIREVDIFEGYFTIYKVDCAPYDVFFHGGVLGHNMKPGGNYNSTVVTSQATITSYTSYYTTSWTTSFATSRVTSVTTSAVTFG